MLTTGGMMCAPVNDYARFLEDGMLEGMGRLAWVDQPPLGRVPLPAIPGSDRKIAAAPRLGVHSVEVLAELGIGAADPGRPAGGGTGADGGWRLICEYYRTIMRTLAELEQK